MFMSNFLLIWIIFQKIISTKILEEQINIHIVPHSHDDAGWLETFDDYFSGKNPQYCVKCILDSVLIALKADSNRTFVWCEISFFEKWYSSLNQSDKDTVKTLVIQKRLEFVGGSWVMNDEATTFYQHIIDQIRLG